MMDESYEIEVTIRRGQEEPWRFRMVTGSSVGAVPLDAHRRYFREIVMRVWDEAERKLFPAEARP